MEFYDLPETVGKVIIPTDELIVIFFRGGRYMITNQMIFNLSMLNLW